MKKDKPFSFRERAKSAKYAFDGIINFFKAEHNAILHLLATIAVLIFAIIFHVSGVELIALIFAIGFVWAAELFNTSIEKMMDFISTEQHPKIKLIKDLSAAAVLVAACVAIAVGCIVFIPKL
jgi:diacylglycerol kinase (ATP)